MIRFIAMDGSDGVVTQVRLEDRVVGLIRKTDDGYWYVPKGRKKGGETFATLKACKASLDGEARA